MNQMMYTYVQLLGSTSTKSHTHLPRVSFCLYLVQRSLVQIFLPTSSNLTLKLGCVAGGEQKLEIFLPSAKIKKINKI